MTIGDLVTRVQSIYSRGVASDDSRLSNRLIYNKLLTTRAKLLSQEAKKKQRITQWNYQTIPCVELIKVPTHECPCIPPVGCEILRSRYKLPNPLTGLNGDLIHSVMSIDRSTKIDLITINAINSLKGNKYANKKENYFIESGYLYISTPTTIDIVKVIGLFEDPIEVKKFESYCGSCKECIDCVDYQEEEFPLEDDMVDSLVQLTIEELIILFGQTVQDETNNANDDANNRRRQ